MTFSSSLSHRPQIQREYGADELVVNYRDACIYGRDLLLLEDPTKTAWLNDACLHFALQRLQQQQSEEEEQHNTRNAALCLDPSVLSFLMHQCTDNDDLLDFGQGYHHFAGVRSVYLPINDNLINRNWQIPGGGTHWSLLVAVSRMEQPRRDGKVDEDDDHHHLQNGSVVEHGNDNEECICFYHFDSVAGHNSTAARAVAAQWLKVWTLTKNHKELDGAAAHHPLPPRPVEPPPVRECRAPQQRNGCDCGLHVLGTTEALLLGGGGGPGTNDHTDDGVHAWESRVERYFHGDPSAVCAHLRDRIAQDIRALATSG